ncbi:MAG: DUF1232 domain-containing protein [Leptolyngbya sp.]|nr:DUF1232 domain-containing protein [Leptolyngbya sp.]
MGWPGRFLVEGYRRLLLHPRYGIWVLVASLAYILSPIDLSPDLLPLLGQIDDVALIVLMVSALTQWLSQRFTPEEPMSEAGGEDPSSAAQQTIDVTATTVAAD